MGVPCRFRFVSFQSTPQHGCRLVIRGSSEQSTAKHFFNRGRVGDVPHYKRATAARKGDFRVSAERGLRGEG